MAWVETPVGFLNLQRAQRITVEPSDRDPGEWVVLAHYGSYKHFLGAFPNRGAAGEFVADLLFEDEQ